ncbi:phosphoglucosamine mutase [Synechococcales cyanobacterium C]|uniref:Phosphoglucosamine mutase n=1 Tax=Petrachloros mirabilis ULC683 TaxID=2781853 RepID=A0A8K1ZVR4_9CYAN|nr:phosphoglucosamine mutase [Petrachloros mirabilis]NCJ05023.1 phosphoglucosamine mutase [Petrachloros mirabilis ULC683]
MVSAQAVNLTVSDVAEKHLDVLLHKRPALFGTDGIRGTVGELLTPTLALQVGYWAGQVLKQQTPDAPFILGQDSRTSSDMLAMALSAGLTSAGIEVWHLGLCPTPVVAYLTQASRAMGGVMISASHNPPEDNGIKFFDTHGAKLSRTLQQEIEGHLHEAADLSLATDCGQYCARPELVQTYVDAIQRPLVSAVNFQGLRVVLDLAWGAAVRLAPEVFKAMGAEVICLHDCPDGSRINVRCGSTHLQPLQAAVKRHKAHLGFAFDGDADRVLAVDSQGRPVDGDYILYLWGCCLQQQQRLPGDVIVSTVMSNLGFEHAWKRQGGTLVRSAVGDQYVHAEMCRHGAMLGGEQSGHILCPHYGISGDGLLTALHLSAIVRQSGMSLAELLDGSFQTYPQVLKNVQVLDRDRRATWQSCEPLQQLLAEAEADMGDQGRVLVRASGTEPVIRVMVEAATIDLTQHWTERLVTAVQTHLG